MARSYRHVPIDTGPRPLAPPEQPDWWRWFRHALWWGVFIWVWVAVGFGTAFLAGAVLACLLYSTRFKRRNKWSQYSAYDKKPTKAQLQRERARRASTLPYDEL